MKKPTLILIIMLCVLTIKAQKKENAVIDYIKAYYADFSTGYNYDGRYTLVSNNYKTVFTDTSFTLTFDVFNEEDSIQHKTTTINLKEVISIENGGGITVDIYDDIPYMIIISGRLAFKTANDSYEINIYHDYENELEQTKIYKAFENLITTKR
jgi:hypothetical protein